MTLVALGNVLHDGPMRERFHADPIVAGDRAAAPGADAARRAGRPTAAEEVETRAPTCATASPPALRRFTSPHDADPAHAAPVERPLRGHGHGGRRRLQPLARPRGDALARGRDPRRVGQLLLPARHARAAPSGRPATSRAAPRPDSYEVDLLRGPRRVPSAATARSRPHSRSSSRRRTTPSPAGVAHQPRRRAPRDRADLLRGDRARAARRRRRASGLQNLFVQTEFVADVGALLATRRPRSRRRAAVWAAHRRRGRGRSAGRRRVRDRPGALPRPRPHGRGRRSSMHRRPAAVEHRGRGARSDLQPPPPRAARARARRLASTFSTVRRRVARGGARPRRQVPRAARLRARGRAGLDPGQVAAAPPRHRAPTRRTCSSGWRDRIVYSRPVAARRAERIARNRRGAVRACGRYGISGDLPIVLVRIDEAEDLDLVRQLLRAHEYWRLKGLAVDLVILNEDGAVVRAGPAAARSRRSCARASRVRGRDGRPAAAASSCCAAEQISRGGPARCCRPSRGWSSSARRGTPRRPGERALDRAAPRSAAGTSPRRGPASRARRRPPRPRRSSSSTASAGSPTTAANTSSILRPGQTHAGAVGQRDREPARSAPSCPSRGVGYTWADNSRENQLTPWSNDPVGDPVGEAIYVRDDETGEVWAPTAAADRASASAVRRPPRPRATAVFEHDARRHRARARRSSSPLDDPVKISRLTSENRSARAPAAVGHRLRRVGARASSRGAAAPHVVTERRSGDAARCWRATPRTPSSPGGSAFLDLRRPADELDRRSRPSSSAATARPAGRPALRRRAALSGPRRRRARSVRARSRRRVELAPGAATRGRRSCSARPPTRRAAPSSSGAAGAADREAARRERRRATGTTSSARSRCGRPIRSMDVLLNRWLLYQTLACRLWARIGVLPVGRRVRLPRSAAGRAGAASTRPGASRASSILRAAARQFVEGDVQHWWHPPTGRGRPHALLRRPPVAAVRRRAATSRHRRRGVLDETVPFLEVAALRPDQDDAYVAARRRGRDRRRSTSTARARSTRASRTGAHGLPLMGTRRLERRHEPRRRRGHGRERLARLVPVATC